MTRNKNWLLIVVPIAIAIGAVCCKWDETVDMPCVGCEGGQRRCNERWFVNNDCDDGWFGQDIVLYYCEEWVTSIAECRIDEWITEEFCPPWSDCHGVDESASCRCTEEACNGVCDEEGIPSYIGGVCAGRTPVCDPSTCCWVPFAEVLAVDYNGPWQAYETVCDGLDNDCDGETDNLDRERGPMCSGLGECARDYTVCSGVDGWTCVHVSEHYEPRERTCDDGLDNDCDGWTDEVNHCVEE